jgi:stage II sporulation protein D
MVTVRRQTRREVLATAGAVAFHAMGVALRAQDEVTDLDLERASVGRLVRVGSPATGAVTTLPLEVYVARVLAAESDPRALDAAREALAIAIRTYALVNEGRHGRDGYDLCDTTHCQVARASNRATRRLTLTTATEVLTFDGSPAPLFYSASCGGYSERASDVWAGVNYPYLQARADAVHDHEVPWMLDLPMTEAESALKRLGFTGELERLEVETRTSSGRAGTLRPVGMAPDVVGGDEFRLAVGGTRVRSTAFSIVPENSLIRFTGRGYGHGVGMCVVGAGTRAMRGESSDEILAQYYPGLELVRLPAVASAVRTPPRPRPFPSPR